MSIKAQLEALIYAAEDPITLDQMAALLKADLLALKTAQLSAQESAAEPSLDLQASEPTAAETPTQESPGAEPNSEQADQTPEAQVSSSPDSEPQSSAPADSAAQDSAPPESATNEASPEHAEDHLGAVEEDAPAQASVRAPEPRAKKVKEKSEKVELRGLLKPHLEELISDYSNPERGIEIREVAGGYRMATKPEHHDIVRGFAKSLKPPIRLSLQSLETLAVIAYKQPVTVPEINDIRGVDSGGVIGTLLDRKLITTAGRKQVIGRPILYKTTKEFLMRFGLKDVNELPSMDEFEKMASELEEAEPTPITDPVAADADAYDAEGNAGPELDENAPEEPGDEKTDNDSPPPAEN